MMLIKLIGFAFIVIAVFSIIRVIHGVYNAIRIKKQSKIIELDFDLEKENRSIISNE